MGRKQRFPVEIVVGLLALSGFVGILAVASVYGPPTGWSAVDDDRGFSESTEYTLRSAVDVISFVSVHKVREIWAVTHYFRLGNQLPSAEQALGYFVTEQEAQDFAREWAGQNPNGKILSHFVGNELGFKIKSKIEGALVYPEMNFTVQLVETNDPVCFETSVWRERGGEESELVETNVTQICLR